MAKIIGGFFNGTGATVYLCIGFIPDLVLMNSCEDVGELAIWSKHMAANDIAEGFVLHDVTSIAAYTPGNGIKAYYGGDTLTSAMQTSTTYGEGVYLVKDNLDYRWGSEAGPGNRSGDAVSTTIDTWTLGNSGNRTGNFNEDVTGTYIGEGSPICIDGKWYMITSLAAGAGESANEVTLNTSVGSGQVQCIKGKYGYKPLAVGKVTPAGFSCAEGTHINANDETNWFMAIKYDD